MFSLFCWLAFFSLSLLFSLSVNVFSLFLASFSLFFSLAQSREEKKRLRSVMNLIDFFLISVKCNQYRNNVIQKDKDEKNRSLEILQHCCGELLQPCTN
jgi:hypothetical protein